MFSELKQEWKKTIMKKLGFKQLFIDGYKGDDWTCGVYHTYFWLSWALKAF